MKKTLLLFFCCFFSAIFSSKAGTCFVDTFETQASIDNFSSTHPGCTEITTDIVISGGDITNLDGLAGIIKLQGLRIESNALLTSISGLSSLTSVRNVNIESNPLLTQLTGLGELTSISQFRVVFNASLTSLAGMENVTTISGYFSVGGNPELRDLSGLENVTNILGDAAISLADEMTSLNGLNGLRTINGFLYIGYNNVLTDLTALNNLSNIGGYLHIVGNDVLGTLLGLDNLIVNSEKAVVIEDCKTLAFCGVKSICAFLNRNGGNILIQRNADGCISNQQVLQSGACQTALPVTLISFSGENGPEGNKLNWKTSWESNNAGFNIEKSLNALKFESIGFLDGAGNSKKENYYAFTDVNPEKLTYYRLKQTDFDASFSYSKIIAVKKETLAGKFEGAKIYPNPARGELVIEAANRNQKYSIKTLNGTVVKEATSLPTKPVDTRNLQDGLYLLTVGKEVFKVMIAN